MNITDKDIRRIHEIIETMDTELFFSKEAPVWSINKDLYYKEALRRWRQEKKR